MSVLVYSVLYVSPTNLIVSHMSNPRIYVITTKKVHVF